MTPRFPTHTAARSAAAAPSLPLALIAIIALLVAGAAATGPALADEGMWTYDGFPKKTLKEKYGFEPTDEWLRRVRLSAVRLAGGCSGSIVSDDGLVMTNSHCVSDCVQQISTAEKDHAQAGFYAATPGQEARCPEIEVNQLVGIEDVTAAVNAATKGLADQEYNKAQKAEMSRLEKACTENDAYRCDVVSLYHGGRYHLYKYRPYRDARLVFSPEIQSAFFGGDPDNFNFPRYNFDVAFLRLYEDGRPARTGTHLRWEPAGAREGDLVFVPGNPGGTDRHLTVAQLEYLRDVSYPRRMLRLAELRGLLTQFAKGGPEPKRISQDLLLGVENGLKAFRGEYDALLDKELFASKVRAEEALRAAVAKDEVRREGYGGAWDAIARAQQVKRRIAKPYGHIETGSGFSSDLFRIARTLVRAAEEVPKPNAERLREYRDSALPSLKQRLFSPAPIYPDLEKLTLEFALTKLREDLGPDDPFVKKVLGKESPADLAAALVDGSKLAGVDARRKLWDGGAAAVAASDDPMIRLARLVDPDARAVRKVYEDEVEAVEKKNSELVAKAYFEVHGTDTYPDATFTPRVTFGSVRGWEENGRTIGAFTTFAGLYERATGKEPYALPPRWIEARDRLRLDTRFNFVNDCDVIGGNSGSPVVGRDASVVGLIFDGNIHSLGGNFWFDAKVNRSVAVHTAAITEALRTVYGADRLVRELAGGAPAAQ